MSAQIIQFLPKVPVVPEDDLDSRIARLEKQMQAMTTLKKLLREISHYDFKSDRATNFLRYRYNVADYQELSWEETEQAIKILQGVVQQCNLFRDRMRELEDAFNVEVVGKGAPWTPAIQRRVGKRKMMEAGDRPNWKSLYDSLHSEITGP